MWWVAVLLARCRVHKWVNEWVARVFYITFEMCCDGWLLFLILVILWMCTIRFSCRMILISCVSSVYLCERTSECMCVCVCMHVFVYFFFHFFCILFCCSCCLLCFFFDGITTTVWWWCWWRWENEQRPS